jgi:small conductance mechanosensitive channel
MDFLSIEYLEGLLHTHVIPFGINLLLAILIFYGGRIVARFITRSVDRLTTKMLDPSLRKFLTNVLYALLMAVVVIAALERLGVKTTAAIAILGAAGLAVGLALQGSLGNFASGVMIILFKPYEIGDLVSLAGKVGTVTDIDVFNTVMTTPDNKKVILPNGTITGSTIENISTLGTLRVDLEIGIGYDDDIDKAREIIEGVIAKDDRILAEPAPQVAVCALADSSVNFVVRPWCAVGDYWGVRFSMLEQIKKALDAGGVSIPYPQRDVHIQNLPEGALKKVA